MPSFRLLPSIHFATFPSLKAYKSVIPNWTLVSTTLEGFPRVYNYNASYPAVWGVRAIHRLVDSEKVKDIFRTFLRPVRKVVRIAFRYLLKQAKKSFVALRARYKKMENEEEMRKKLFMPCIWDAETDELQGIENEKVEHPILALSN